MAKHSTEESLALVIKSLRMFMTYWARLDRGMDSAVCKDRVSTWLDDAEALLGKAEPR